MLIWPRMTSDELWQLVEMRLTQNPSDSRHLRMVAELSKRLRGYRGPTGGRHGSKLQDPEEAPVLADALLSKKNGPVVIKEDRKRDQDHQRGKNEQRQARRQ